MQARGALRSLSLVVAVLCLPLPHRSLYRTAQLCHLYHKLLRLALFPHLSAHPLVHVKLIAKIKGITTGTVPAAHQIVLRMHVSRLPSMTR